MNTRSMKFTHKGQEYEVRAACFGEEWRARVFLDGKPVNSADYAATTDDVSDARVVQGRDLLEEIMIAARDDFIRPSSF